MWFGSELWRRLCDAPGKRCNTVQFWAYARLKVLSSSTSLQRSVSEIHVIGALTEKAFARLHKCVFCLLYKDYVRILVGYCVLRTSAISYTLNQHNYKLALAKFRTGAPVTVHHYLGARSATDEIRLWRINAAGRIIACTRILGPPNTTHIQRCCMWLSAIVLTYSERQSP